MLVLVVSLDSPSMSQMIYVVGDSTFIPVLAVLLAAVWLLTWKLWFQSGGHSVVKQFRKYPSQIDCSTLEIPQILSPAQR